MMMAEVKLVSEGIVTYASTCVVYLLNLDVTLLPYPICFISSSRPQTARLKRSLLSLRPLKVIHTSDGYQDPQGT